MVRGVPYDPLGPEATEKTSEAAFEMRRYRPVAAVLAILMLGYAELFFTCDKWVEVDSETACAISSMVLMQMDTAHVFGMIWKAGGICPLFLPSPPATFRARAIETQLPHELCLLMQGSQIIACAAAFFHRTDASQTTSRSMRMAFGRI